MADKNKELSRAIETGNSKYNMRAASAGLAEVIDFAAMKRIANRIGFADVPTRGESKQEKVKEVEDYGDTFPFQDEGYFANYDHDLLSQRFVLHPILCEDESVLLAAEPKTGKTALALTVGLHVACGIDLGPSLRVAEPRGVLYFGLEGRRAIRLRIAAWRRHMGELGSDIPDDIPLFVVERSKNLLQENARQSLANAIKAADNWLVKKYGISLGAIFLDTFTKAMPGGDQNSVEDTSAVFDVVARVRETGVTAAVVFIHHKARAGNIRGSTNIEADPDVLTSVRKEGSRLVWSVDRARSIDEGGHYHFELSSFELGNSSQGFAIRAPIVRAMDADVDDTSTEYAEATGTNRVMQVIISLGKGTHDLNAVHKVVHGAGFGPSEVTMRHARGRRPRTDSNAVQEFYSGLIPVTGYIFAGFSIQRVVVGGRITGLLIF